MRKLGLLIIVVIISCFTSCEKEESAGISRLTQFATFTLKGDERVFIMKGSPFVDPGVEAKEGDNVLTVSTSGLPDVNQPGVYNVSYKATNKDGFQAVASRVVIVYATDATAIGNDFTGKYARTSNASLAVWTKIAPGVYEVFNPGGAPGTNLTVIVFNPTGTRVFIPQQIAGGNPTSSDLEVSVAGAAPGTLERYTMKIVNPGYGTGLRTFVKQ